MSEKFDIRTIEHKIKTGEMTEAEYQKYLAELPDESANAVEMDTKFVYTSGDATSEQSE